MSEPDKSSSQERDRARSQPQPQPPVSTSGSEVSWERFSHWLCCVCVVTFDLELGQALETVLPSDFALSDTEKTNICYLSFPDSNSGCMGDTQFHFRIRCSGTGAGGTELRHANDHIGAPAVLVPDQGYYYGFVHFRQVKDSDIRRGYFQKSVVLLTRLPYINFFTFLVQKLAPEYFTNGIISLETACHCINTWPHPRAGQVYQLPILGLIIHIRLPAKTDKSSSTRPELSSKPDAVVVIPSVHDMNLYQYLQPLLSNFELVWELVLVNEPLAVMASSPSVSANTVQSLVSLILPLKYAADYRPFFTIHDSEFKYYTTKTQAPPQVILGVTNPFFVKTLSHWPHIIRAGDSPESDPKVTQSGRMPGDSADVKAGIVTKYKPMIQKDKMFARLVTSAKAQPGKKPGDVQNVMIKRHALELTTSFIIPLERYIASLMPLKKDVSPWRSPPQLKPFQVDNFLKIVEGSGPHLTSGIKANWVGLYKRFLDCPNFIEWYSARKEEANQKLRIIHLDIVCRADLDSWVKKRSEVEIVGLLLQIKQCLETALHHHHPSVPHSTVQALRSKVGGVILALPEDLQSCLGANFL